MFAPIVLFTFNRPDHTKRTVEALLKNDFAEKSELFIFCDGPRNDLDKIKTDEVRNYLDSVSGFKKIVVRKRDYNLGLAESIIEGVTELVNKYGKVIVLEDDLVTSRYFLKYMNDGLEIYSSNEKVASIVGWIPDVKVSNRPETFFLKGTDCWGWATWDRAWKYFEPDANKLLLLLKERGLEKEFNCGGSLNCTGILEDHIAGKCSSWAMRWDASLFIKEMYSLFPGVSMVDNIGLDGSGRHSVNSLDLRSCVSEIPINVANIPVIQNEEMRMTIDNFFFARCQYKTTSIKNKIGNLLLKHFREIICSLKKI